MAHGSLPGTMTYADHVGYLLNVPRAERRQVWRLMTAMQWAAHQGELPSDLFDAQADTEAEAVELEYQTNKLRG